MHWAEQNGLIWIECGLGGARAIFSTRRGGTSRGDCAGLNLGIQTPDKPHAVVANRKALVEATGVDGKSIVFARQVHADRVEMHSSPREGLDFVQPPLHSQHAAEADGQAVSRAGLAALVFVADCLPVAMTGSKGSAMVHCGWRPMDAGIIGKAAALINADRAVVGPGIGPCCYQVGSDVSSRFSTLPGTTAKPIGGVSYLDLREVARQLLQRAGVSSIEVIDICTSCRADLFYSHRRDRGSTGRQAGMIIENRGNLNDGRPDNPSRP